MSLYAIYMDIRAHGIETTVILALLLKFIDFTPIKLNPWKALVRGIRKFFTGDLAEKVSSLETNQIDVKNTLENVTELMRARISDIDHITSEKFEVFGKKIDALSAKQDKLSKTQDEINMMTSRYRIIRASDELREGKALSREHVEQLGDDVEIYREFCRNNPEFKNHRGQRAMQTILDYEDRLTQEETTNNYKKENNNEGAN